MIRLRYERGLSPDASFFWRLARRDSPSAGLLPFKNRQWFQSTDIDRYLHTNHYLALGQAQPTSTLECTETRLKILQEQLLYKPELTLNSIRQLLDINEESYPTLKPYGWHDLTGNGGTLVTMLLDLNKKEMQLREGFDSQNEFHRHSFQ